MKDDVIERKGEAGGRPVTANADAGRRPSFAARLGARWRLVVLISLVAFAAFVFAAPRVVDHLLSSGIEAADVQAQLDALLPAGATKDQAEHALESVGVHFSFDEYSNRYTGTIPESRDFNWMGVRRDVYVVVEFDVVGRVQSCTVRDIFTFL